MEEFSATGDHRLSILTCLRNSQCARAVAASRKYGLQPHKADLDLLIAALWGDQLAAGEQGQIGRAQRLKRHRQAVTAFRDYGPDPLRMINEMEVPRDYAGKILLVHIAGGLIAGRICLRSGDDWHREILRNTGQELKDLGFDNATVSPLGGAHLQVAAATATIWGTSDQYGTCDKALAQEILQRGFKGLTVRIK